MANQTQMAVQARVKDRRHPDQSVSKSVRQAGREADRQSFRQLSALLRGVSVCPCSFQREAGYLRA